jgi:uncharacterized protein YecE (DUF72 family)
MREAEPASNLRIGTSGWSYPNGPGTWNGVFYPRRARRRTATRPGFDELAFYAEHFDTVEVNSSFYRAPAPAVTKGWAERTPSGFEFSLKLHQKFTHPGMFTKATGQDTYELQQADVNEFRASLDPIAQAGKLGALLAQFPASFKDTPESRAHLEWLLRTFREYPVAVELRHRGWSDRVRDTVLLLNEFHAAWVQIDEPKFRFSIRQNYLPNVTGFYYMRLHGRNAAKWWRHANSDERYDYLYSPQELKPFAETADAARRLVKKMYLYMNNHFAAKAVANAVILKHQLDIPVQGEYPAELVERYPDLRGLVATASAPQPALHTLS